MEILILVGLLLLICIPIQDARLQDAIRRREDTFFRKRR
jgi:hypothetical protein